jgi:hypothetical protein
MGDKMAFKNLDADSFRADFLVIISPEKIYLEIALIVIRSEEMGDRVGNCGYKDYK